MKKEHKHLASSDLMAFYSWLDKITLIEYFMLDRIVLYFSSIVLQSTPINFH